VNNDKARLALNIANFPNVSHPELVHEPLSEWYEVVWPLMKGKPKFPIVTTIRDIHSGRMLDLNHKVGTGANASIDHALVTLSDDRINGLIFHYLANLMWTNGLFNKYIRSELSLPAAYSKMGAWLRYLGHIEWAPSSYCPPGSSYAAKVYEQYALDCLAVHGECADTCKACGGAWRREREAWERA
jgi:hypothetical protein